MKKRFIISGIGLCSNEITGMTRYLYEIITRLDKLIDNYNNLNIEICYPKEFEINLPNLNNIELIPLQKGNKKWFQVIRKYANKNNAIFVGMCNDLAIKKDSIICLHDIRSILNTEYDPLKQKMKEMLISIMAKLLAKNIVTVSETSKDQIRNRLSIKPEKIKVISPGWEHMTGIEYDDNIFLRYPQIFKGEYFYSLGSIATHKNYKWILEVAKREKENIFVIGGGEHLKKWSQQYNDNLDNVIFVGYITDGEHKSLLRSCKAFIHPSKFEGFGLPPMEALSENCKIIVSNTTALPEVYGESAYYINPNIYDVKLLELLGQKVEHRETVLKKYSWDTSAEKWLELFLQY